MTRPLPNDASAANPPRSAADRERLRVRITRKWAYLICTTTYVPFLLADLEQPLREMVDEMFAVLANDPLDLDAAERIGVRLVELECVDKKSLQCTVDVLSGPLLADEDVAHLAPERVFRLFGALAAGFTDAVRRRTIEQQDSMCRALMEVARTATRTAEKRRSDFGEASTELTLLRRELSHQLLHDALTGLPNRQFLTTRLEEVLNSGGPTTLCRIELDGFFVLNDGLGWPRTDALLDALAARLRNAVVAEGAMVARVDRAGFAVLHEHRGERARRPVTAAELAGRLTEALADPAVVADLGLALTASIGVVQSPPHRADPVAFMRAADVALRLAKARGPGQWHVLTPDECVADSKLLRLAATMPGALENDALAVGYRLRVALADERPDAVEAFPLWDEAGLAGQNCVALAEQTGLSPRVGRWLLETAGEHLREWDTELPLSVSLSPNQSSAPDLVDDVLGALANTSLPADRLRLAMPAAEVFDGRQQTLDNLASLARAGVRTAVHDFGGNPSEVMRLPDLPLRSVSLAPRLVAEARAVNRRALTTKSLMNLTALVHEAGVTVAVDDIRTAPEIAWWRCAGADTATGPLFPVQGQP